MGTEKRKRYKRIREVVTARDGLFCCYCNKELTIDTVTLDHIVPESLSGGFNVANLTVSCYECNNKRGNQPFFEYCKQYNFSEQKLEKYKILYLNNLRIKILNVAKEEILNEDQAVPAILIEQACTYLQVEILDFTIISSSLEINFYQAYDRRQIKYYFEQLIKIISRSE